MSPRTRQAAAERLVEGLHGVFGDRLRSVAAYGPPLEHDGAGLLPCLALVTSLTAADLDACAALSHGWPRDRVATPLQQPGLS